MHKWTSGIDGIEAVAVREWSNELAGLSPAQIERGLSAWDEDWPPSAPEFKHCCLGGQPLHRTGAHKLFPKALPKPKAKASIVEGELDKMRRRQKMTPEQIDQERAKLMERP
jgi:hypothetical protein